MEAEKETSLHCAETAKAAAAVYNHCEASFDSSSARAIRKKAAFSKKFGIGFLGVLATLAIIGSMAGKNGGSAPAVPTEDPSAGPTIQLTARDLDRRYNANEAEMQQAFGDSAFLVSGRISSINLHMPNDAYLVLTWDNMFLGPQVHLTDTSKAKAPSLANGQNVTLRCSGAKFIIGTVMLSNCELQ